MIARLTCKGVSILHLLVILYICMIISYRTCYRISIATCVVCIRLDCN